MHKERAETANGCQGLLLDARGAVLLLRRTHRRDGDPRWYEAPGGPVRAGKPVRQALARGIRQQTGLRVVKGMVGPLLVDGPSRLYLVGPLRATSVVTLPRRSSLGGPPPFDHYVWAQPAELHTYCNLTSAQLLWAALRSVRGPAYGRAAGRFRRAA
ncbi:NUDIX domain-containing protein [Streptomyces sp. NPDC057654]|uniref:NUDIX domain-containing protein n=1 Tax=Streptomyces sp. NPDC057654 TaxID=3346196 RepID=UPI0036AFE298